MDPDTGQRGPQGASTAAGQPTLELNNGVRMPQLGCGMFKIEDSRPVAAAALSAGYRLIDTAASYRNEEGVGTAVRQSGLDRSDLFITSKLANSDHGYDNALRAFDATVAALGMEQVDLYLIHWPVPARDLYVDTWRALEHIYRSGRARAIGVSNFLPEHLDRLLQEGSVVPAVNQVELHPGYVQEDLRRLHRSLGITTQAWSPLGRGRALLDRPEVRAMAQAHGRTPAQVVIRWHLTEGHAVIPKSANSDRLRANLEVFDFELTADELAALTQLQGPYRVGPDPRTFDQH